MYGAGSIAFTELDYETTEQYLERKDKELNVADSVSDDRIYILVKTHNPYNSCGQIREYIKLFKSSEEANEYARQRPRPENQSWVYQVISTSSP